MYNQKGDTEEETMIMNLLYFMLQKVLYIMLFAPPDY